MNTIIASEGKWLYNGEVFAKQVSTFGDVSMWQEVDDDFKVAKESQSTGLEEGSPKALKLEEIDNYDKSNAVNEFTLQGNPMWLPLQKREDMRQSLTALKAVGVETFTYWLDTTPITMSVAQFEAILNAVEVYAIQCYNVTAQHKANVLALANEAEIEAYDYRQGYPQKLVF